VIAYTKLLVSNQKFVQDIQEKIGKRVDSSSINMEIENFQSKIVILQRNKSKLEQDIDNIADDDRNAKRKREDMNRRLDKLYEEIYAIEDNIADCEKRKEAVEHNILTTESIYSLLLAFEQLFDKMNREDKRKILESLISAVYLYPKETWQEKRSPIKEIRYTFPVSPEVMQEIGENVSSVETVVLMSRKDS